MTDKWVIQTWKLPVIFSKNEQNEPVTSRKTNFLFVANGKIQAFRQKSEFWKFGY